MAERGFRAQSLALRAALVPRPFRRSARIAPRQLLLRCSTSCIPAVVLVRASRGILPLGSPELGLDRSRASCTARSVCIPAQIGVVQWARKPLSAIELLKILSASSQGCVFRSWPLVAAEAVEGTGGRGHQGGAREDKTAMDGRLAGRRRPRLRGNPQGSGYGPRPEYQPIAQSNGSRFGGRDDEEVAGLA
jgi:hypothetical protein